MVKLAIFSMSLHRNEFIVPGAQTDLLGVGRTRAPVGGGMGGDEAIGHPGALGDEAHGVHRLAVHRVGAGHVDGHRIKGGEHAHIRHDGRVVLGVAVAVGRDLVYDVDVEVGTAVHHGLGILGDLCR